MKYDCTLVFWGSRVVVAFDDQVLSVCFLYSPGSVSDTTDTAEVTTTGATVSRYTKIRSFDRTLPSRMSLGISVPHTQQVGGSQTNSSQLLTRQLSSSGSVSVSVSEGHPAELPARVLCR